MTDAELESQLQALHGRLLSGDRIASAELAELALPMLKRRLGRAIGSLRDGDEGRSIINASLAEYLTDPYRYDPSKGGLLQFLLMDGYGDIKTAHIKERKENARLFFPGDDDVVFRDSSQKYELELHEDSLANEELQVVIDELDPQERDFIKLWKQDVRATAPFAEVLGISHLPVDMQRKTVRNFKDALKKKIRRRYAASKEANK